MPLRISRLLWRHCRHLSGGISLWWNRLDLTSILSCLRNQVLAALAFTDFSQLGVAKAGLNAEPAISFLGVSVLTSHGRLHEDAFVLSNEEVSVLQAGVGLLQLCRPLYDPLSFLWMAVFIWAEIFLGKCEIFNMALMFLWNETFVVKLS